MNSLRLSGCRILGLTCLAAASFLVHADSVEPRIETAREPEISDRVEKSVTKACDWLAKNQGKDGALKSSYSCASTALAGLAWLAAGSTPYEGVYAHNIRAALDFILHCSSKGGFICEGGGSGGPSGMYGHGYATQFLAQAHGMIREEELAHKVKEALERAVRSSEGCQNSYGGWNSSPNGALNDDGSGAIAVMQVTALRAAESCGVSVRPQIIEKAKKYLLAMTNDQGWYAYNWHARGNYGNGSLATTGAGMYMLSALGLQNDPKYAKGIKNIMDNLPSSSNVNMGNFGGWYAYSIFYASLAIYQHGGTEWYRW
jgi:hypothetical protein